MNTQPAENVPELTEQQKEEILNKINTPPPLPKPLPEPDLVHHGNIPYKIEWRGTVAHITIGEVPLSLNDKVAMMYNIMGDFDVLISNIKHDKDNMKKNFTQSDKAGISKARFIMDKFIKRFLGAIHANNNQSNVPVPQSEQPGTDEIKPVSDENIKSEEVKADENL